jgi:8-oxo-dGTP pyrophosphatase MutT (NUDIX family)
MGCPASRAPFFMSENNLSAGVVVVRRAEDGWRVLLLRVYNYWDCPKGVVEGDEEPLATARREVREETTIDDLEFAWGESFTETEPYGREKKRARYYIARTYSEAISLPVNPQLGKPEHHEWRWCDFESAEQLVNDRLWMVLRWAQDLID